MPESAGRAGVAAGRAGARRPSWRRIACRWPTAPSTVCSRVHCLEVAERVRRSCARCGACWRPEAGSLIVVPNRRGRLGAPRQDAVRAGAPLQPPPARDAAERSHVHARRLGRRAVRSALDRPSLLRSATASGSGRYAAGPRRLPASSWRRRKSSCAGRQAGEGASRLRLLPSRAPPRSRPPRAGRAGGYLASPRAVPPAA